MSDEIVTAGTFNPLPRAAHGIHQTPSNSLRSWHRWRGGPWGGHRRAAAGERGFLVEAEAEEAAERGRRGQSEGVTAQR